MAKQAGKTPQEDPNIFRSTMKVSVTQPKLKLERFYKEVEHIQSLYKNEIAGELSGYFKVDMNDESFWLNWLQEPPVKIKNAILDAAYKFIV